VSVLLYGVLPEPCDAAPPAGVRALDTPAGVAWVRTLAPDESPAPAEQRATLRHALDSGRTPAPARAGSRFADDDALLAALARSAEAWRTALERVRDRVEMMVFVPESGLGGEPESRVPSPDSRSGRAYLEQVKTRLASTEVAERWRVELRAALGDLAADDAVIAHPSGHGALVSHLVPRERVDAYRACVTAWRAAAGVPRAVVLGPWPPFSFVSDESR